MPPERALVLDGEEQSTLSIVRSLGRQGVSVTVGAADPAAISRYSRYAAGFITYPDPLTDPAGFLERLVGHVAENGYELLIPVTELTTHPVARSRSRFTPYTRLAIPEQSALEMATDKERTIALAQELGIPTPQTVTVADAQGLADCAEAMRLPCVLKPIRSIAESPGGQRAKMSVAYAHHRSELLELGGRFLQRAPVLIQEHCAGQGVGIELLVDRGEVVHAFQHQRLHEVPLTGGGSSLRRSETPEPELVGYAQQLVRALGWHGVLMVEFKREGATGTPYLMEVNGRFWGSLPLAVAAGADFPWLLYQLLVHGRRPPPFTARPGHFARKLQPDCYWYLLALSRRDPSPLIRWPSGGEIVRSALLCLHPHHHIDAFYWRDPRPAAVDLGRTLGWFATMLAEHGGEAWQRYQQLRPRRGLQVLRLASQARRVLFICHGNINRSAVAQRLMEHRGEHLEVTTESAGLLARGERPADPVMVAIAAEHGLDLGGWRSRTVTAEQMERADLVLAMELAHLRALRRRFPEHRAKMYLLSGLDPFGNTPTDIADPYGQPRAAYERCFRQVEHCLRNLSAAQATGAAGDVPNIQPRDGETS
ncbi:ATP-grasp domain-containing protein [Halorhodospira sp. 9621]|uniref:arsenate reductase/protein-tyrosine-phosphatase family protein n=1 Tax=Halorhodospira sp. 9621 TaxID=2899135 RepID=UPI001EE7BF16|nr:ATP-grasp domain-containing protein [Halorhodospira sp. 9621]MCG5533865.1 ATP-grasp domain-containing protein [Halorhodospira sp. 9621]